MSTAYHSPLPETKRASRRIEKPFLSRITYRRSRTSPLFQANPNGIGNRNAPVGRGYHAAIQRACIAGIGGHEQLGCPLPLASGSIPACTAIAACLPHVAQRRAIGIERIRRQHRFPADRSIGGGKRVQWLVNDDRCSIRNGATPIRRGYHAAESQRRVPVICRNLQRRSALAFATRAEPRCPIHATLPFIGPTRRTRPGNRYA